MPFSFLHAADLHLDTPFTSVSGYPERVGAALREASLEAWDALIQTAINRQVRELAPVLNAPSLPEGPTVQSSTPGTVIATMRKRLGKAEYLFAVNLAHRTTRGSFEFQGWPTESPMEVLGESRSINLKARRFDDAFEPYGVHLYRLRDSP